MLACFETGKKGKVVLNTTKGRMQGLARSGIATYRMMGCIFLIGDV